MPPDRRSRKRTKRTRKQVTRLTQREIALLTVALMIAWVIAAAFSNVHDFHVHFFG